MQNLTLKIHHDDNPENPFESWDCLAPLCYEGGRNYGTEFFNLSLSDLIQEIPKSRLTKKTLELFDIDYKDNGYASREDYNNLADYVSDLLRYEVRNRDNTIETIETLCNLANIQYYSWTSRGYSQGDSLDCILIATKEYLKTTGIKNNKETIQKSLKEDSKIFDAWVWGDTYGYKITKDIPLTQPDETLSTETEEEIIYSCWGFYGLDELKSHIKSEYPDLLDQFETASNNIIY